MQVCCLDKDGFREVDSATLPSLLVSASCTVWVNITGP